MNIALKLVVRLCACLVVGASFVFISPASTHAASSLLNESFTGNSTVPGQWTYGGNSVCLTAGDSSTPAGSVPACATTAIDAQGSGVLRLTNNDYGRDGFVILNTPLNSHQGFRVLFDMYQYGPDARQSDGMGIMLIDGATSPTQSGGNGGSLGYGYGRIVDSSNTEDYYGIVGGYAGIGFDTYGGYSITHCGDPGWGNCNPLTPNGIGIRGSQQSHYKVIQSKPATQSLNVVTSVRSNAKRTVELTVSPTQKMTITIDYHDGNGPITELNNVDLATINGSNAYPDTLKLGFSGSTGGYRGYHELHNLAIQTLDPNVTTTLMVDKQSAAPGEAVSITARVNNAADAAPTLGTIYSTTTLPASLIPLNASGNGWTCSINGQVVSCSRPGSGADALQSGQAAPDITINTQVLRSAAPTTAVLVSTATTLSDANANDAASLTFTVNPAPQVVTTSFSSQPTTPNPVEAPNTSAYLADAAVQEGAIALVASAILAWCGVILFRHRIGRKRR